MSETAAEPPLWMLQLENRQKKYHRLAHEIGAGAPCLKCVDLCPGLDLHFWRKLCRNCRCRKEDHEVIDDDNCIQFEILFSSGDKIPKRLKKAVLDLNIPTENEKLESIQTSNKTSEKKSVTLDWVPPDVPLDLAAEYMQKLPATKLPITGTSGALYRKQQFEKQLPPHDLEFGLCHELSQNEIEEFQKYLNQIKSHVVGQGKVEKLTGLVPTEQMAEVVNQNLQKPEWSSRLINLNRTAKPFNNPPENSTKPVGSDKIEFSVPFSGLPKFNLKSPSDYILTNSKFGNTSLNDSSLNNNIVDNISEGKRFLKQHPSSYNDFNMNDDIARPNSKPYNPKTDKISAEKHFSESTLVPGQKLNDSSINNPFHVRNPTGSTFRNVLSDPASFNVGNSSPIHQSAISNISQLPLDALHISESKPNQQVEYSDSVMLQNPSFSEQLKNKADSNQQNFSHVPQDPHSHSLPQNAGNLIENMTNNDLVSKTILYCQECDNDIYEGEVVVSVKHSEKTDYWHPQCFVCTLCQELLVDLVYFYHKNKVYCGRHYAEVVKIPRCFACDELIFGKQYTLAEGHNFHIRHFCCIECDEPLAEKEYIPLNDHPTCIDCYNKKHLKVCLYCKNVIQPQDKRVSIQDMHWHATDSCFICNGCKRSLLQSKMVISQQKPFCNKNCVMAAL